MNRALAVALLAVVASGACATIVDVEANRAPPSTPDDRDDPSKPPPVDAAGESSPPRDPIAEGGSSAPIYACACEAGAACCIASATAPACVAPSPASCSASGSLLVGCVRPTTDGRDCCWKPDGGVAQSAFGAGCTFAACLVDDDCAPYGGKCSTLACDGVALGVCASSAPSWFVCPP